MLAAYVIGMCAERRIDRRPLVAALAFVAAQLAVFGIGVPWLKVATGMSWADAFHDGFPVFIVGGLIKAAVAAATTSGAWRLAARRRRR